MKKLFLLGFLVILSFLFSCEKDSSATLDKDCEICNSECCEQIGTDNCCCSGI